jgi:hypothetical protein
MLSVLLFGIGTAHAVLGVNDDVPGTDLAFPIVCEKGGTLNTLYAVTNTSIFSNSAALHIFDVNSNLILDTTIEWTAQDVVPGDCQTLIAAMSPTQQTAMEVTINGKTFYAGYVTMITPTFDNNVLISNIYIVDIAKGFAAGFNGFDAEGALDEFNLCEFDITLFSDFCVTAFELFPRYAIFNADANTFNWWIIWEGANEPTRILDGVICNEEELCFSLTIPIPDELNFVNVADHLPAGLFTAFPHNGYADFFIDPYDPFISTFGWAYQRDVAGAGLPNVGVIHPIHRYY